MSRRCRSRTRTERGLPALLPALGRWPGNRRPPAALCRVARGLGLEPGLCHVGAGHWLLCAARTQGSGGQLCVRGAAPVPPKPLPANPRVCVCVGGVMGSGPPPRVPLLRLPKHAGGPRAAQRWPSPACSEHPGLLRGFCCWHPAPGSDSHRQEGCAARPAASQRWGGFSYVWQSLQGKERCFFHLICQRMQ